MTFQPFPDNAGAGDPLDARVSVEEGQGGLFEIWFRSSGGNQPNTDRKQARELILKRLGEANASIVNYRVGKGPALLENAAHAQGDGTPAQDWNITKEENEKLRTSSLRLLVRLPEQDNWDKPSLCKQLQSGNRDATFQPLNEDSARIDGLEPMQVIAKLRAYRNVIVEGVAGTGKSHLIRELRKPENFGKRVKVVVFHPSTSYEDFVEGLRPREGGFEVRDGDFLEICREAAKADGNGTGEEEGNGKPPDWVLVIDEINRANTSKVLGDLLYAIEPSKRVEPARANEILSAKSKDPKTGGADEPLWPRLLLERLEETAQDAGDGSQRENGEGRSYRQRLAVPKNLYILGTMNTTDRSVGTLDLALRRRFVMHRMNPLGASELKQVLEEKGHGSDLHADVDAWNELNTQLKKSIGPDAMLGHSYFFEFAQARAQTDHEDLDLWRDLLLPQLAEIIVAFNAVERVTQLLSELDTGMWTIEVVGQGVDAYPMVVRTS